jgi:hypothetical protein
VFALQGDNTIQAITSDGTVAWTASLPAGTTLGGPNPTAVPDFQGGLVIASYGTNGGITKLDGITGQPYPTYIGSGLCCSQIAVHTDGTIFTVQDLYTSAVAVIGIDPITGAQKFSVPLAVQPYYQDPTENLNCSSGRRFGGVDVSRMIIAGDGYAYVSYAYPEGDASCSTGNPVSFISHLRLLRVSSAGAYDIIPIQDVPAPPEYLPSEESFASHMISNSDTGVLLSWGINWTGDVDLGEPVLGMAMVTGASLSSVNQPQAPGQCTQGENCIVTPVLQAQDGSFVGTYGDSDTNQTNMIAFDGSGNVRWSVPNETPQIATADGGVIGLSGTTYDLNGNATGQVGNANAVISWSSAWYLASSGVSALALPLIDDLDSVSFSAFAGGNSSNNLTAFLQCCYPSLALLFGAQTNGTLKPSTPDVSKTYPLNNISCGKSPSQVISDMEGSFASFGNYNGTYNFHHIPWAVTGTVTFTGIVSLGATITIHNVNVDTITGGHIKTQAFDVAVQVTQVSSTGFTFTTLPGHVLYPATISFTASSSGTGKLNFAINVNGKFANKEAEVGYYAAGKNLEDNIWNHVLAQVQSDCRQ